MSLPDDLEKEILAYLHLEFGEDPNHPQALKLEDLCFEGNFAIDGVKKYYWKCGASGNLWATAEQHGDSYCLGITSSSPNQISTDSLYEYLKIQDFDRSFQKKLPIRDLKNYVDIGFPGETVSVYAEAHTASSPVSVTIGIRENVHGCYIRASVGIAMSYTTKTGKELILSLGTSPWQ